MSKVRIGYFLILIFFMVSGINLYYTSKKTNELFFLVNESGRQRMLLQRIIKNNLMHKNIKLELNEFQRSYLLLNARWHNFLSVKQVQHLDDAYDSWMKIATKELHKFHHLSLTELELEINATGDNLLKEIDYVVSIIEIEAAKKIQFIYFFTLICHVIFISICLFIWERLKDKRFNLEWSLKKTKTALTNESNKRTQLSKELTQLISNASGPIFGINADGKINEWNTQLEMLTGYKKNDVLGTEFTKNHIFECQQTHFNTMLRNGFEGLAITNANISLIGKNKQDIKLLISIMRRQNEVENNRDLIIIGHDITNEEAMKKKNNELIQKVRKLSANILLSQEEERKHVSHFIHDELGQLMASQKISLNLIKEKNNSQKLFGYINNALDLLDKLIVSARQISKHLRPPQLDILGLEYAIDQYIRQNKLIYNTVSFVQNIKLTGQIDIKIKDAIYRITQEGIKNALTHSKCSEIIVGLNDEKNKIQLSIFDNGNGIKPLDLKKADSFGIIGIEERLYPLNGTLTIVSRNMSAKTQGTELIIEIPSCSLI